MPPSWQVEREIPQKARPNDVRSGNDLKPHNPVKPITSSASPIFYHTTTTIAINTPMESCPYLPGKTHTQEPNTWGRSGMWA